MKNLLLTALLFFIISIQAQQQFTNYGSKNAIKCLADDGNKIWIGTEGGLYARSKTTGNIILMFDESNGLPSNYINDIAITPLGDIIVGTRNGLAIYDGETWDVINGESIIYSNISQVAFDTYGNIWFISKHHMNYNHDERLYKIHNEDISSIVIPFYPKSLCVSSNGLVWIGTHSFDGEVFMGYQNNLSEDINGDFPIEDNAGNMWFSDSNNEGLLKYDGNNWETFSTVDGLLSNTCGMLESDMNGYIWVKHHDGVTKFDPIGSNTEIHITNANVLGTFRCFTVENNNLWAGCSGGLFRNDMNNGSWANFIITNTIISSHTYDAVVDNNNIVIIGTAYGVSKFSSNMWTNISTANTTAFAVDNDNNIWMGGIFSDGFRKLDVNNTITEYSGIDNIGDILINDDGTIWFASRDGLFFFDGANITQYTTVDGLIDDHCTALAKDVDGNLWVGTYSDGLSIWNGTSFTNISNFGSLFSNNVLDIIKTQDNRMFVSTSGGLTSWDGSSWSIIQTAFPFGNIWKMSQATDGTFWFASNDGIIKYNSLGYELYNLDDGVVDDRIEGVALGQNGEKWFATYSGVTKVMCENPTPLFTNETACLPSNTIFTNTSIKTDETTFYEWDIDNNGSVEYTTENITHLFSQEDVFSVKLTVINDECSASYIENVSVYETPDVTLNFEGEINICYGNSIDIEVESNNGSLNPNYTYNWTTGGESNSVNIMDNGIYTVTVNNFECEATPLTVEINVTEPIEQELCMVTVDTSINRNLIVWEKPVTGAIQSFNIYKETSTDNYSMIGSQLYADVSEYIDFTSQPSVHADKYKISIVDTCGNESDLSSYHQTMNLSQAQGIEDDEVVLIWNKYIDESGAYIPANYLVYRGTDIDNMVLENTLTGGLSTYNYNVHDVINGEHFMVAIDMPECNPSQNKATGGPYYQSMSNIEDEGIIATRVNRIESENIGIYPNPMEEYTIIKSSTIINTIIIFNVTGEKVRVYNNINSQEFKLDREALSEGTYVLEINNSLHKKLVVK